MGALGAKVISEAAVCAVLLTTVTVRLSAQTTTGQHTSVVHGDADTEPSGQGLGSSAPEAPTSATAVRPKPEPVTELVADRKAAQDPSRARLPDYMREKRRMSQEDIDDKKEGRYVTAIPIAMYDDNKGLGFGARVFLLYNGKKESPFFEYTPYRHRTYIQVLASTGGWQLHKLDYDGLYLGDSPYRFRATAFYEKNIEATFYGIGAASMNALSWSGSGHTYPTLKALEADLRARQANGTASSAYNLYRLQRPGMNFSLEREFFGGRLRALVGASLRHVSVTTYDGRSVKADDAISGRKNVNATQGPTLLSEQCATGRIAGCNGGWDNVLRLALAFDTRDFEPDPNAGVFVGASGQVSSTAFGASSAYARFSAQVRGFYSPFHKLTDLVLAGRVTYQIQSSNVPFHSMSTLTFADGDEEGLGGLRSLRGYRQNRFVGPVMSFANAEIRWMPLKFRVGSQHFGIGIVPFLDSGRVYDQVELKFDKWRFGYGAGMRIAWNQATIVVADYGMSTEDASFGLTFGHNF